MPQFRPLPRFDETDEPAEVLSPKIDAHPRLTPPPVGLPGIFLPPAQEPTTDALSRFTQPATTGETGPQQQMTRGGGTGRIPVILLTGPQRTPATDQLATLAKHTPRTNSHRSLSNALQASLSATGKTKRVVVIHADPKHRRNRKKKKRASGKHLSLRLRHSLILFTTLVVLIGFMISLSPLADGPNGFNILQGIGSWLRAVQNSWQLPKQFPTISRDQLNANLPYMSIPNSPYLDLAEQDAEIAGISPIYFVRQITQESGFNPNAVSVTNAQGIAQFEPATAAGLGVNPWDPVQALRGAAQLMASYAHKYGDYAKALAAYNAGSAGLSGAEKSCGGKWLSCMPGQTRNYVYRIMGVS